MDPMTSSRAEKLLKKQKSITEEYPKKIKELKNIMKNDTEMKELIAVSAVNTDTLGIQENKPIQGLFSKMVQADKMKWNILNNVVEMNNEIMELQGISFSLAQLEDDDLKELLKAKYFKRLTNKEIEYDLGISHSSIYRQLGWALTVLAREYNDLMLDDESASILNAFEKKAKEKKKNENSDGPGQLSLGDYFDIDGGKDK